MEITYENIKPFIKKRKIPNIEDKITPIVLDADNIYDQQTMEIKDIKGWEVMTPYGWQDFKQIKKINKPYCYKIVFDDGEELVGSPYHKIMMLDETLTYLKFLNKGDIVISGRKVKSKKKIIGNVELFDLLGVKGSLYLTDNIVSSNCAAISWMDDIWASAGLTLTRSQGKCIAISCVTDDTYIFTNKGIKQIKDYIDYNLDTTIQHDYVFDSLYEIIGNQNKLQKGNLFHYNGLQTIYKIKTRYSELKCSKKHKLYTYNDKEHKFVWEEAQNLSTNNWLNIQSEFNVWKNDDNISDFNPIVTSNHKNIFIPKKLTSDICYLLGLYIAEGCANLVKRNNEIIGGYFAVHCENDINDIFKKLKIKFKKRDRTIYKVNSYTLVQLLIYLGFDITKKAPQKEIPKRLFECSKENIIALLQGIFDGDGSADKSGKVSLCFPSEKLIDQVRIILVNLGILSYKYETTLKNLNKNLFKYWYKFTSSSYNLEIYTHYAKKYFNLVGFRLERKQERKKYIKQIKEDEEFPNSKEIFTNLVKLADFSIWELNTYYKFKKFGYDFCTKDKIEELLNLIIKINPELENHPYILELKEKVLIGVWVPIKKIEILKEKQPVYDFSLPHEENNFWCHSVIYNGVLGHQTPKGMAGWYFEQYTNAKNLGWNIITAHWSEHPLYRIGMYQYIKDNNKPEGGYLKFFNDEWPDLTRKENAERYKPKEIYPFILDGKIRSPWYDFESKKLGVRKTKCELDCSFAGSGGEVIDPEKIRDLEIAARLHPPIGMPQRGLMKSYKEFFEPEEGHTYIIPGDTATGDGSDYSAFCVIDITTLTVVATYKDQLDPREYANILARIGKRYFNALIIVEYQEGLTTLLHLKDVIKYKNLFHTTLKKQDVTKVQKRKVGFWQSESTRTLGGDKLEEVLNTGELKVYSMDVINELYTWVWDKRGRRTHLPEKNDDLCMALTIGMYFITHVLTRREYQRENIRKYLRRDVQETIVGTSQAMAEIITKLRY
jgi:hypothetical protein